MCVPCKTLLWINLVCPRLVACSWLQAAYSEHYKKLLITIIIYISHCRYIKRYLDTIWPLKRACHQFWIYCCNLYSLKVFLSRVQEQLQLQRRKIRGTGYGTTGLDKPFCSPTKRFCDKHLAASFDNDKKLSDLIVRSLFRSGSLLLMTSWSGSNPILEPTTVGSDDSFTDYCTSFNERVSTSDPQLRMDYNTATRQSVAVM